MKVPWAGVSDREVITMCLGGERPLYAEAPFLLKHLMEWCWNTEVDHVVRISASDVHAFCKDVTVSAITINIRNGKRATARLMEKSDEGKVVMRSDPPNQRLGISI